uniref:Putative ovule protein n=1 Tax=Solanum chacoense TaxID=4108 RepID=A0A0V0IVI8_SOLCH
MEAGRLAAEYLVSKGVLHPSALSGKYQNGSLRNPVGEFQGFRSQEADFMGVPMEGRISALPHLGSAAGDVGHGRKRFPEEYNSMGSRSFVRESRRNETVKNYGSEFNRELGRVGSWNRVRNSPDVDAQDNAFSGNRDEQRVAKNSDVVLQNSPPRKIDPEIDSSVDSLIDSEPAGQNKAGDDAGKKASPISTETNLPSEDELQHTEKCIEMEASKIEVDQVDVSNDNGDLETKAAKENIEVKPCTEEHTHTIKSSNNLLSVWRFEHVPKKTRSSLANRVLKVFDNAVIKDENTREMELPKDTQMYSELNHVDVSAGVISSPHSHDARNLDSGKSEPLDLEEESRCSQVIKQVNETDSSSLGDSMVIKEDETIVELPGFESCSSINLERGEKRALEHDDDCTGRAKKPRELVSSTCSLSDGILYHSNSMEDWPNSQEPGTSHGEGVMLSLDEKKLVDIPLITKSDVEPGTDFTGKQLFPGSLKTCDLNLLEASVVNETQNADPVDIIPGITGSVKEEAPVDIDLTMSSNCNTARQYAKSAFDHIGIEVIDLDNDSEQEDKALNNLETRSEVVFTGSDGFSNNPHGTDVTPDVQDGYGLMISELLGTDIPSCSSVPENMNSFHNDMGLHNGEGVLGDDDSIYMSLGEIPISFLTAWEQQTQEFGKPF